MVLLMDFLEGFGLIVDEQDYECSVSKLCLRSNNVQPPGAVIIGRWLG